MDATPHPTDGPNPGGGEDLDQRDLERIYRFGSRRAMGSPIWNLEVLEAPLMDEGLDYTVNDGSPSELGDHGNGWIDFELPTRIYRNASGRNRIRIRLTVTCGRLTITAPDVYPPNSLRRTTKPPPDAAGNLRVVRLGEEGESNLDLMIAADGTVTAVLLMETILRPFNRNDIVQIAQEFAVGVDYLDFAVRKQRLLLPRPGGTS
jgi:hypothetical protein